MVKTRSAVRTFVITPQLLREVIDAISKLDFSPDGRSAKATIQRDEDKEPLEERLKHLVALCRCAVDFMELESKSLREFEETPLLVFFLLAKAAGVKFPEGWIEQRLFQPREASC